jgi:hypothetical protein
LKERLLVVLAALAALPACAPIGLVQTSQVLGPNRAKGGIAATVAMPLRKGVLLEPDGKGTGTEKQDLAYKPLPALVGWYRHGVGGSGEAQVAFEMPSTTTSISYKQGIFGGDPDSVMGMAIAVDIGTNTVFGQSAMGGSVILGGRLGGTTRWHLTGRAGTWPPLWALPHVTVTGGVSWGTAKVWHLRGGWAFDLGSGAPPAALLLFGYEKPVATRPQPFMGLRR